MRYLKASGGLILTILGLLNLWIWNSSLPFTNYTASVKLAMVVQAFHELTIFAELVLLLWLGQALSRHPRARLLADWLLLVTIGSIGLVVLLFWQNGFSFASLLTAALPVSRGSSPLASALLIPPLVLPAVAHLTEQKKGQVRAALLLAMALTTAFNVDLWGFNASQSLLAPAAILVLGATLPAEVSRKEGRLAGLALLCGLGLTMLMPAVSTGVHGDWSTVHRFDVLTNVFLVYAASGLATAWPLSQRWARLLSENALPVAGFLTLASPATWWTIIINAHGATLISKLAIAGGLTVVATGAGLVLGRLWRQIHWPDLPASPAALKKFLVGHRFALVTLGALLTTTVLSFYGVATSWSYSPNVDATYNTLLAPFILRQGMVALTLLLLWLAYRLLLALTNRYWLSLGLVVILELAWTIANRMKILARSEPILPSELRMVSAYGDLLQMVSWWFYLLLVLAIAALALLLWWLARRFPHQVKQRPAGRVITVVATLLVFGSANWWNHSSSRLYTVVEGLGDIPSFYNQLAGVRLNGPLVQFMNNLDVTTMDAPAGYSKATMTTIAKRYSRLAKQINRTRTNQLSKQTVIFNLSESFADPRRVPGIKVSPNPIPNISKLKKQTTSGLMISSGYGGGTANMEYMSLTGLATANFTATMTTPFTQLVPFSSRNWAISRLFKEAVAIHPYVGTFYSRTTVYKKFGFARFYHLGSKYAIKYQEKLDDSPYLSDKTAYANALDVIKQSGSGQFINLVTMQNHYPYNRNYYHLTSSFKLTIKDQTPQASLADYVAGIHYTDQAVAKFIRQLDRVKKPVTVVFYGDHLPGIYPQNFTKYGLQLHETDYFIYSNKAARKQGAKTLTKHT